MVGLKRTYCQIYIFFNSWCYFLFFACFCATIFKKKFKFANYLLVIQGNIVILLIYLKFVSNSINGNSKFLTIESCEEINHYYIDTSSGSFKFIELYLYYSKFLFEKHAADIVACLNCFDHY